MDNHNIQFGAEVEFKALDPGTGAWAVKKGPDAIPAVPAVPGSIVALEDFEGALWQQITFVSGDWALDTLNAHSPTHSFRSKVIVDNQTSSFFIQNDVFEPQLSFWLTTNTESGFDFLKVFVDSVEVYSESGSNAIHRVAIPIGFGFDIEFRYSKDFSSSPVGDGCWVDDIVLGGLDTPGVPGSPAHPLVYAPLHLTDDGERLKVDVEFPTIEHLACATDSVTVCPGDDPLEVVVAGTVNVDFDEPVLITGSVTLDEPIDVHITGDTGTLNNGAETAVAGTAVSIRAANVNRKGLLVQNTGLGIVRIGATGVTATTGYRLNAGDSVVFSMPYTPVNAIYAIREGLISSTVLTQEIV